MWIRFRKDLAIFGSPEEFWRFCDKPEYQYWELSFDFRVVSGLIGTTIGWLRILGFCVAYKNTEKHPHFLFSQRQPGYKKWQIGKWCIHLPDSGKTKKRKINES